MLLKLRFLHALLIKLLENTFSDSFSHQILFPSEKAFKRNKHKKNYLHQNIYIIPFSVSK